MSNQSRKCFSARVSLKLIVDGESLSLCRTGPDQVELREPRPLRDGEAILIVKIEDHEEQTPVFIYDVNPNDGKVNYIERRHPGSTQE